jgi:glycosyltransferase involved in cell wall biosynthesis
MHLSVVIPTFNRCELLVQTIPLLAKQAVTDLEYEVVFVINGSSDGSAERLQKASEDYPGRIRYFYIDPTGGPSAPRNYGIRHAQGQVVIILDDDVIPDPDLVQRHWEYHQQYRDPRAMAVGKVYVPERLLSDPMSLFHSFPYHQMDDGCLSPLFFWTCNVSFKREFMLRHGMFDENMLYYEDIVCGYKLRDAGMQLRFLPKASGQHLHKLQPSALAEKGLFTGRWLYVIEQITPDPALKERFGIISSDLKTSVLIRRLINRSLFTLIDNWCLRQALRVLGAERGQRTKVTDCYYYLLFRRNMVAGYYQAKRGEWTHVPLSRRAPISVENAAGTGAA